MKKIFLFACLFITSISYSQIKAHVSDSGICYTGNFVSTSSARWLTDKNYVDSIIPLLAPSGTGGLVTITKPTGIVTIYKPASNTDLARGTALTTAIAAMAAGDNLNAGAGNYDVESSITLLNKSNYNFNGSRIYHTGNSITTFIASSIKDFSITGNWIIEGNSGTLDTGFAARSCRSYQLIGGTVKKFGCAGISLSDNGALDDRMDGAFLNIVLDSNNIGLNIYQYAEYNQFTNINAAYNTTGIKNYAGNNRFVNCHIDNNGTGIDLENGGNNSHGSFVGGSANHNTSYTIYANGNTISENFIGMDFFATSISTGYIQIIGAGSIRVTGGFLSAPVACTGTLTTTSVFQDMIVPTSPNFTVSVTAAQRTHIIINNVYNYDGTLSSFADGGVYYTPSVWTDISGTSTIVGFASYINKFINIDYDPNTKIILCVFDLYGASNTTGITFTIPGYTLRTGINSCFGHAQTYDNSAAYTTTGGRVSAITSGGNILITVYKDNAAAAFTNGNNKAGQGEIYIPVN